MHLRFESKNFTYALSQLKDNVVLFTLQLMRPGLIDLLIAQIAKALHAVRPERKFPRRDMDKMRKRIKRHYIVYKRVA